MSIELVVRNDGTWFFAICDYCLMRISRGFFQSGKQAHENALFLGSKVFPFPTADGEPERWIMCKDCVKELHVLKTWLETENPPLQSGAMLRSRYVLHCKSINRGRLPWEAFRKVIRYNLGLNVPLVCANPREKERTILISQWVLEHCNLNDRSLTRAADLRRSYKEFCESLGQTPLSKWKVAEILRFNGKSRARTSKYALWSGIELKVPYPHDDEKCTPKVIDAEIITAWLNECCVLDTESRTPAWVLRASYDEFCASRNEKPLGRSQFARALEKHGMKMVRTSSCRFWCGIAGKNCVEKRESK